MRDAFQHTLHVTCKDMRTTSALLRSLATAHPTSTVRTLLRQHLLYAKAGDGLVEVWQCLPVPLEDIETRAQEKECSEEIPIRFTFYNNTQDGYMDPQTLVISHHGTSADCALGATVPMKFEGQLYIYERKTGLLANISKVKDLQILNYHHDGGHDQLMKPQIYSPVTMYSWEEMEPSTDLNALLKASAAQAEVMAILGAQFKATEEEDLNQVADRLAKNIVGRGLMAIVAVVKNPILLWMSIVCMVVAVNMSIKIYKGMRTRWDLTLPKVRARMREWRRGRSHDRGPRAVEESHPGRDARFHLGRTSGSRQNLRQDTTDVHLEWT